MLDSEEGCTASLEFTGYESIVRSSRHIFDLLSCVTMDLSSIRPSSDDHFVVIIRRVSLNKGGGGDIQTSHPATKASSPSSFYDL